tara:strand:+ start:1313 stop:1543 length:231 start_codon:yes stop_codon:yes gene_type:complete
MLLRGNLHDLVNGGLSFGDDFDNGSGSGYGHYGDGLGHYGHGHGYDDYGRARYGYGFGRGCGSIEDHEDTEYVTEG